MERRVELSALGRGPFQTGGIHAFIAVGPFGLFGDPLINEILKTWPERRGQVKNTCETLLKDMKL